MFELLTRAKNGLVMIGLSLQMMWHEKKLFIFPLLKMLIFVIACFLMLNIIFFGATFTFVATKGLTNRIHLWLVENWHVDWLTQVSRVVIITFGLIFFLVLLLLFLVTAFVFNLINMATIAAANQVFEGRALGITESFSIAWDACGMAAKWTSADVAMHTLLRFIGGSDKRGWGQILSSTLGLAWGTATFFVIPIIVQEKIGLIAAVKKSATLFKQTLGESAALATGLSVINFLIFPGMIGIILLIWRYRGLSIPVAGQTVPHYLYWMFFTFMVLLIGSAFLRMITSAALQLYKAAAYRFIERKNAGIFTGYFVSHPL